MYGLVTVANGLAGRWAAAMWPAIWQSTVLAAVVFLLTLFLRRASSPLRFWLWMLVPLRLLVMPMLTISVPVLPATETTVAPSVEEAPIAAAVEDEPMRPVMPMAVPQEGSPPAAPHHAGSAVPAKTRLRFHAYLMAAWLFGVAFSSLQMARGWWRTRRIVAYASEVVRGPLMAVAGKAARTVGLECAPRLLVTNKNVSPFIWGLGRPAVVIPAPLIEDPDNENLVAVLAHEFAHVRRHDPVLGLPLTLCKAIYFFHPVVHVAERVILLEREKACDEYVLATSGATPGTYARALVAAAQVCCSVGGKIRPSPIVTESFSDLKRRLLAIASNAKPKAKLSTGALAFLVIVSVLSVPRIALTAREAPVVVDPVTTGSSEEATTQQVITEAPTTTAEEPTTAVTTRTIHFPKDRSLGRLSTPRRTARAIPLRYRPKYNTFQEWEYLCEARGDVRLPVDEPLALNVGPAGWQDLSPLAKLGPDDLYMIVIDGYNQYIRDPDSTIMPHLAGLTGLRILEIYFLNCTDDGIGYIKNLRSLRHLTLGPFVKISDAGLPHLEDLKSLEVLSLPQGITDSGLAHLARLKSLRELSLGLDNIRGPGLAHLAELPHLTFLRFWGGKRAFHNSALQYLKNVRQLRSLEFRVRINNTGLRHLSEMTNLEELRFIQSGGITDVGLVNLKPLRSLRLLSLGGAQISDRGVARLCQLESLEDLSLPSVTGITDQGLAYLAELTRLKRLSAGGMTPVELTASGPYTDEGLLHLSRLKRLEELSICSGVGITDAGVSHIAQLPNLKRLDLMCNGLSNDGLATLATIKSLRYLTLGFPNSRRVTVSGLNHLNALTNLMFLTVLSVMRDNAVLNLSGLTQLETLTLAVEPTMRDEDVACLANLTRLTSLQSIRGVSDEGIAHLAGLTGLERLTAGGPSVTDSGLRYLANMKKLNHLTITGDFSNQALRHLEAHPALGWLRIESETDFSPAAVARLREALPNLRSFNERPMVGAAFGGGTPPPVRASR